MGAGRDRRRVAAWLPGRPRTVVSTDTAIRPSAGRTEGTDESDAMQDTKILKNLYIFRGLNQIQLAQFNKVMHTRPMAAGDMLIRQGDEPDNVYVVKSGRVQVLMGEGEDARVIAELAAGEHFGEIGLIDHRPRSASVKAVEDGEVCVLANDAIERILDEFPEVRMRVYENFLEALCERLRSANENLLIATEFQEG